MKVAGVDTVMPEWVGLEVKPLSAFVNVWGHKYFEVELPLEDHKGEPIKVVLSEHQVVA